ncbi:hypothetical protein AX17_005869 [Amanita inopinata Kibby_2008]|nr:hypothetical protein AX17_005869 [Amanita inopinata Kibby_2008]
MPPGKPSVMKSLLRLCLAPLLVALVEAANFQGDLTALNVGAVFPGDQEYANDTQAYNLRFDFKPAAMAFPTTPDEVSEVVKLGVQYDYKVVARSGGHSYIANGLGGMDSVLVIDMSKFKNITVHDDGTATIGSGNRLGDIALTLNDQGRAMPHGACPYVGIGGHASYGGFGFTSRMWGLTLDVIQSIDLVLPNGTISTVSATQHGDLFWAMRGAGSSYAITTSITVQTFPVPPTGRIFVYAWTFNSSSATAAISDFQQFVENTQDLPPALGGEFRIVRGPSLGTVVVYLFGGWWGPSDELDSVLAPYMSLRPPVELALVSNGTYIDSLSARWGNMTLNTTTGPDNTDTFYVKSLMTPEDSPISDKALQVFFDFLANDGFNSEANWFVEVELYGGRNSAINAVPWSATAFAHRSSLWTLQMYAYPNNHLPPFPSSGFTLLDDMANTIISNSPPDWDYGAYPNYVDDRLQNYASLYYNGHYPLLRYLKSQYDPLNTFDFPTGIQPKA